MSSYWMGEYRESLECREKLLDGGKLPDAHREHVTADRGFARSRLRPTASTTTRSLVDVRPARSGGGAALTASRSGDTR
ncbi:hypothetical protein AB0L59_02370 [Streptomyces sp. NPDC052109]|uniref:hypothetical protein n=1 Tax=Streptomyces sp. NPDC052109 TaxID=3155527 RepID=UPI00342B7161